MQRAWVGVILCVIAMIGLPQNPASAQIPETQAPVGWDIGIVYADGASEDDPIMLEEDEQSIKFWIRNDFLVDIEVDLDYDGNLGQPNGEQRDGQAADHAVHNSLRLGLIDNITFANRAAPIGIQQIHQHTRVAQACPGAQTGSEQGEHKALGQKKISHGFSGEPNGKQRTDLRGTLFHAKDKEEPHENERGEYEEKAQANEQATEVIG